MAFQVESRGLTFVNASFQVESTGIAFAGGINFQVESTGLTFSGGAYGFVSSNLTPESGETLVLSFSGDPAVAVTWRIVSITGGYPAPTITASGNLVGNVRVPAVKDSVTMVIGGKQGTNVEKTVTVTIAPTPHGYYTAPGVWVPATLEMYV
jgi:hypothetical protein